MEARREGKDRDHEASNQGKKNRTEVAKDPRSAQEGRHDALKAILSDLYRIQIDLLNVRWAHLLCLRSIAKLIEKQLPRYKSKLLGPLEAAHDGLWIGTYWIDEVQEMFVALNRRIGA